MANEKRLIDVDTLTDTIEDIDWYHVNKKGELVAGANPANNTPLYKAEDIYRAMLNAPAIDAEEVVHGRWVEDTATDMIACTECGHAWNTIDNCTETFNYCPNCGAKMDGGN